MGLKIEIPCTKKLPKRPCICKECGKMFERSDMQFTYDCHGIPYRLVCPECYEKCMAKGYDGERYTESDENLDWVW